MESTRLQRLLTPLGTIARWAGPLIGLVLICGAVYVLQRQLDEYSYADVIDQLAATPLSSIALALLLTAGAFATLVGFDALALAYVGHSLPLRRIALGSFVAYSMAHSLGFHMITSGSIRYRFWSSWGLSTADIAKALGFASTSFLLGMLLVCGVVLLAEPQQTVALLRLPTAPLRVVGFLLVAGVLGFLVWMRLARPPFRLLGAEIPMPKVRFTLGHILLASSDWMMAASVAYVLLPGDHGIGLLPFAGIFLFALLVGAIGHVPGGVGVFEALVVLMLEPWLEPPAVLGSLIVYRLIYYVLPFVIGLLLMIAHEARMASAAGRTAKWIPGTISISLGTAVFSAGTVLLLSGAVKMNVERMATVQSLLPISVIEISHFAASMIGAALLLLAWFIQRRMERAYVVVSFALAAGAIASLARGLVWEVAILLVVLLLALLTSRNLFKRQEPLALEPLSTAWLTGIVTVLLLTVWLGVFSFKDADYSASLWTEFLITSDLPRFMRATAGALLFVIAVGLHRRSRIKGGEVSLIPGEPDA